MMQTLRLPVIMRQIVGSINRSGWMARMLIDRTGRMKSFKAALLLLACLAAAPASADQFLWSVKGQRNTVHLLGSMHLLPNSAYPLPDVMEQVYRRSDIVVFETDIGGVGNEQTQIALLNAGMYPEGESLINDLRTDVLEVYAEATKELDLPVSMLNRYRPWLAALTIEMSIYARKGFKAELGIDRHFHSKATMADKRIIALETVAEQSELFTGMSKQMSENYLALTLANLEEIDNNPNELYEIWADGDEGEMADLLEEAEDDYPAIYNRFIRTRNQKWLPTLLELLKEDRDVLVVVGAMHLPGDHGLVRLLENAGFDPRQLD